MVLGREGEDDYIFSILTGYFDPPEDVEIQEGMAYNPYFPGGVIGMPQQLFLDSVEYEDGEVVRVERGCGLCLWWGCGLCLWLSDARHSCHCQSDGEGCHHLPQMGQR